MGRWMTAGETHKYDAVPLFGRRHEIYKPQRLAVTVYKQSLSAKFYS